MKKFLILSLLSLVPSSLTFADDSTKLSLGANTREDVMVTVYNNNYGLIREVRKAKFPTGAIELEYQDVAQQIDATSVAIKSLTTPDKLSVLEQNYRYDLLSPQTLMGKFVGKEITISAKKLSNNSEVEETRRGTLLSINSGSIVQFKDSIEINPQGSYRFDQVPSNLLSHPTLIWLLDNQTSSEQKVEVSYLTNSMSWAADYIASVNADDTKLDLTGWVTLTNNSGASYENAKLKLVAGDVQRVQDNNGYQDYAMEATAMRKSVSAPQFQEKSFFEYHLYTLDRPTTLLNNESKQVTLLHGTDVPVKKVYVLESQPYAQPVSKKGAEKQKVSVMIEFENKEASNLGMPLPKGKVRVYKADTDKSLQLVGEDLIDHTPRDEKIRLKLGEAFDIVAERTQTDYKNSSLLGSISGNDAEASYKIVIKNHKEENITVTLLEHFYQSEDWEITRESTKHKKLDSRTAEFSVPVSAKGETEVTYTVRMNWG